MSIVVTHNLMCEVCKKRIELPPYKLQHQYTGLTIKSDCLPSGWIRLDNAERNHVCSNECLAAHSAAQKLHGEDYLNNPACMFSW